MSRISLVMLISAGRLQMSGNTIEIQVSGRWFKDGVDVNVSLRLRGYHAECAQACVILFRVSKYPMGTCKLFPTSTSFRRIANIALMATDNQDLRSSTESRKFCGMYTDNSTLKNVSPMYPAKCNRISCPIAHLPLELPK